MSVFWRYWLLQIPGWVVLGALLVGAHRWLGISVVTAVIVFAAWIVKDAAIYPWLRPHYDFKEKGGHEALIGKRAVAQEPLSPRGYVKLRGELWRAELEEGEAPVGPGEAVTVRSVDGLTLRVRR